MLELDLTTVSFLSTLVQHIGKVQLATCNEGTEDVQVYSSILSV
jgi:hypothetical protein